MSIISNPQTVNVTGPNNKPVEGSKIIHAKVNLAN